MTTRLFSRRMSKVCWAIPDCSNPAVSIPNVNPLYRVKKMSQYYYCKGEFVCSRIFVCFCCCYFCDSSESAHLYTATLGSLYCKTMPYIQVCRIGPVYYLNLRSTESMHRRRAQLTEFIAFWRQWGSPYDLPIK